MAIAHNALAAIYPALRLYNNLMSAIFSSMPPVRILIYHDIPPSQEEIFSKQLLFMQRSWQFITPQQFDEHLSGYSPIKQRSLLLTFDDGYLSNRHIAEGILKPLGISALFFIVSDFMDITNPIDARRYIKEHFFPEQKETHIPLHCQNMNWNDLEYLLKQGHTIGAHTKSHARLSEVDEGELWEEIVVSADRVEQQLGITVKHFAYTFGDLKSFSSQAFKVAHNRFDMIFTGLRGPNSPCVNPFALHRDAICPSNSHFLIGALLEGGADQLYRHAINTYKSWSNR